MTYAKGVFYERDLIRFFEAQGFSTTRIAGSGHNTPADILAMRKGKIAAVEVKAHRTQPRLAKEKVQELKEWCERAGAHGFLAWRAPRQEWLFLPMKALEENQYKEWLTVDAFLELL